VRIVAELGDFQRFDTARKLMGYLGVIPSEDSSGARRRPRRHHQGGQQLGTAIAREVKPL